MPETNSTSLVPFEFNGRKLRSILRDGEPWFVGADVCKHLDIVNVGDALSRLDVDEKDRIGLTDVAEKTHEIAVVSESGLYSLVLGSRKPEAKAFKKWVTSEVLPAIRKTGTYAVTPSADEHPLVMQARAMLAYTQRFVAIEAEQAVQADKIKRIEAKQQAFEEGSKFFTVLGYSVYRGLPSLTNTEAASLGKRATKLSREQGLHVDRVRDPRFGVVGSYHEFVLEAVFAELLEGL